MKFEDVLAGLRLGTRFTNPSFDSSQYLELYQSINGTNKMIQKVRENGSMTGWVPQHEDIIREDWEEYTPTTDDETAV